MAAPPVWRNCRRVKLGTGPRVVIVVPRVIAECVLAVGPVGWACRTLRWRV